MLGRTASHVYWLARYVERAENLARLLSSTYHMSLLPSARGSGTDHWRAPLALCADPSVFDAQYDTVTPANVLAFMVVDPGNSASIRASIRYARDNAHATRNELTTEVWEAINQTYYELETISYAKLLDRGFQEFFDWVKERSHLYRGAAFGTMRRGEAFAFSRLGTFIERSDNTARFLALKWGLLSPSVYKPVAAEDYYHWGALLRAFSAFKAYREVYSVIIEPRRVAEMLVLRKDMPRSLFTNVSETASVLSEMRPEAACTRLAQQMYTRMEFSRIDGILRNGLPAYLNEFVRRNGELNDLIGKEFMLVQ